MSCLIAFTCLLMGMCSSITGQGRVDMSVRKPYGKGNYTLKYKEIRRSTNTTLVLAYNRLVSICHAQTPSASYMRTIPVEPYQRRVKTYWIERQERYEASLKGDQDE